MERFEFVERMKDTGKYYILKDIEDDTATIVSMDINASHDGVVFYSEKCDINILRVVPDYYVNMVGPLYRLMESFRKGNDTIYIEER